MLSFESALTDIFATIIAFILFEAILSGQFDLDLLGQTIGRAVAVGLILGFGVGIPWMFFISKLTNAKIKWQSTYACPGVINDEKLTNLILSSSKDVIAKSVG